LILRGEKREEYRSRPTNIRERVYLYAAMKPGDPKFWIKVQKEPGELPTNRIVGSVEIVDCKLTRHGDYAYVLANPKRLRTHLHAQNQPKPCFWRPQY
jgi:ASCH domain